MLSRVSVIIPTYCDAEALSDLLNQLRKQVPAVHEIIVVNANEQKQCVDICQRHDVTCLSSRPCRGEQLDKGARYAHGDILWFLHADSMPAVNSTAEIIAMVGKSAAGGFFRFQFSGSRSWRLRLFERLTNWRCRYGIPYGDQGLFVERSAYFEVGGFAHQALFEEVALVRQLRRNGRFVSLELALPTSSRRWQQDGWWRRTLLNRTLAIANMIGVPVTLLSRWYMSCRR